MDHIAPDLRQHAVAIDDLMLDPINVRKHGDRDIDATLKSLRSFGQRTPIVIRSRDRMVLKGNGTVMAARKLGWSHLAAVTADDMPEAEQRAYAIADNRTGELAPWDPANVDQVLESIRPDLSAPVLEAIGFTDRELDRLMAGMQIVDPAGADPDPVALPAEPNSKPGHVYRLGPHILLCGDATDAALWALAGLDQPASMIWTDPPYGIDYAGKVKGRDAIKGTTAPNRDKIANDTLSGDALQRLVADAINAPPTQPGAALYVCGPPGSEYQGIWSAVSLSAYQPRWMLVWVKIRSSFGRADYHFQHENIIYGWKPGAAHYFTGHHRSSVFEAAPPRRNDVHPTMKPVELIEPMILNSSRIGEWVADPFGGSGSTLIAAARVQRRAVLAELHAGYCDVIRRRWGDFARAEGLDPGPDAI